MKQMKRLLLLLALVLSAGVVNAQNYYLVVRYDYLGTFTENGVTYYGYKSYYYNYGIWHEGSALASLCGLSASGDVVTVPYFVDGSYYGLRFAGYWPDQEKSEDITVSGNINTLRLPMISIYGHFYVPTIKELVSYGAHTDYIDGGGGVSIYGTFDAPNLETISFYKSDCYLTVYGTLNAPNLETIANNGKLYVEGGTINSPALTSLNVRFTVEGSGKFKCDNLRTIDCKNGLPTFPDNVTYSQVFSAPSKSITAYVYDLTGNQINELRSHPVWREFKEIINHKSNVSYTLTSDGNADVSLLKLNGNDSYYGCQNVSLINRVNRGSKTGNTTTGAYYAVEIKGVDPGNQIVSLKRNGFEVELGETTVQNETVYFYDEQDLQEDVSYEVSVTYKTCDIFFQQEGYRGTISYSKWINGETTTGAIYGNSATITCAQGEQITLSIPYDLYKPQTFEVNGSTKDFTYENGRATVKFYAPRKPSTQAKLTWQQIDLPVPQGETTHHYPQIMILRLGEGDVLFKGMAQPAEAQSVSYYEQTFGYPADADGWVVSALADCQDAVTTVTVPDVDLGRGGYLGESAWGFRMEIKPANGQGISRLMVGTIIPNDDKPYVEWEDFSDVGSYLTHNAETGTYTFDLMGAVSGGYGAGDYIVNLAIGAAETAVETGQTINFVRKGGRGNSHIEWYDDSGRTFGFGEGSTSVLIPDEELQGNDLKMYINTEEGETFHVYKDGMDITGQFQLNGQSTTQYWAPLEEKSASYALFIEEAPDANPEWKVQQGEGMTGTQIVITRNGVDEETTLASAFTTLKINDEGVEKVTLKVPVGHVEGTDNPVSNNVPIKVVRNGMDITSQMNFSDPLSAIYEVPVNALTNATWEVSFDLSRQQTFIRKGGTLTTDIQYEIYSNETTVEIPDGAVTKVNLPPYGETNGNLQLNIRVADGEELTVLRNGVDVTNVLDYDEGEGYRTYFHNGGNMTDEENIQTWGFNAREAAVWEITIDDGKTRYDVNRDGLITIADVTKLVNKILGKE